MLQALLFFILESLCLDFGISCLDLDLVVSEPVVIFWGDWPFKEDVNAVCDWKGDSYSTVDSWMTIKDTYLVGYVVKNGEIMFYSDNIVVRSLQRPNELGDIDARHYIKVVSWLVKHQNVWLLHCSPCNHEALKFTSWELLKFSIQKMFKFQLSNNFCKVSATVIDFGQTFSYISLFDLRITG